MYQVVGYHRPTSLAEALQLVAVGDRVPLGGGVHLHHDGGAVATDVVDLQAAGLDVVDISATSARLGAMVRLHTVAEDQRLPALIADTARAEQPSTLRTLATIGGTIAAASGDSLFLAALLAYDATVRLASDHDGERTTSLTDLLTEGRRSGELIVDITVATDGAAAVAHTGRTPRDVPIVGVVARRVAGPSGDSVVLGVCGVSATPLRLDPDRLGSLEPIGDHRATSAYRTHLVEILAGRVMEQLS